MENPYQRTSSSNAVTILYKIWLELRKLLTNIQNLASGTFGNIRLSGSCILIKPSTLNSTFQDNQTMRICNNDQGGIDVSVLINGTWVFKQTL
jgi:hypothetical protein